MFLNFNIFILVQTTQIVCVFFITAPSNQYFPGCLLSPWCNWWSAGGYLPEYKISWGSGAGTTWYSKDLLEKQIFWISQKAKVVAVWFSKDFFLPEVGKSQIESFHQISNHLGKWFKSSCQISNLKSHKNFKSQIFKLQISNQISNLF